MHHLPSAAVFGISGVIGIVPVALFVVPGLQVNKEKDIRVCDNAHKAPWSHE